MIAHPGSAFIIGLVGSISKIWLFWLNRTVVKRREVLLRCLQSGGPLITVANHHSCLDEPLIWGIMPWHAFLRNQIPMRWVLAAKEIVFTNPIYSLFFTLGRCVPVVRGAGVNQMAVDQCLEVLNNNGWVHIYPEGRVNFSQQPMRLKWGIGRLINESKRCPTVLPIWHTGMETVLPESACFPRICKKVLVYIGQPIGQVELEKIRSSDDCQASKRISSTDVVHRELYALQRICETLYASTFNARPSSV